MTKIFFCGFEPAKMHCEFKYTANAFQDESWYLLSSKGYEFNSTDSNRLEVMIYSRLFHRNSCPPAGGGIFF